MEAIIRELTNSSEPTVNLLFESEKAFIDELDAFPCLDRCSCGGFNEMTLESITVNIEKYSIKIAVVPMLKCTKCGQKHLPEFTKKLLFEGYQELRQRGNLSVESKPTGYQKRYQYAEAANYIYDHWDYESIPGLQFDEEHSIEGFLTPVYFDKRALVSFISLPEYEVDLFSETYGTLSMLAKDDSGFQYEWSIPFGINSNGKLVFWLGDLDDIVDDVSTHLLKAFNVNSDHQLTNSEFYQAQMCCIFSKPIAEEQILLNRKCFIDNVKVNYGIDLAHLSIESEEHANKIIRPVVFTMSAVSVVINAYDKILVEGISVDGLMTFYEKIVPQGGRGKGYEKWQSIKLLDGILEALCKKAGVTVDVYSAISPLYILHDYRILLDHLLPKEKQDDTKQHIVDTLNVQCFEQQETIYLEEIRRLNKLYAMLSILTK